MRPLALASLLLLALAACDDGGAGTVGTPTPSPSPSATDTPTPTATPSAEPSPDERPIPPAWAAPIDQDLPSGDLADATLVPPDAQVTARVELPSAGGVPDQIAVAYAIGDDPFAAEHGFALWQRFAEPPAWSVVLAFVDAPEDGVLGIVVRGGDLTGDGHADVLTFEDTGGSGACGRWRVLATIDGDARQLFSKRTCDTDIALVPGALAMREAVYEPDDAHCCPSAFRTTTLEWDGTAFVETDVREEPAPNP